MKTCKGLKCWMMVFCMVLVQMMSILPVSATQQEQTVSVTVTLEDNGNVRSGIMFSVYQVADAVFEGEVSFALTKDFAAANVSLDVKTAGEMIGLIDALDAYISSSAVTPVAKIITDEQGVCTVSELAQGMYLLVPANADAYGIIDSSLVSLPYFDENGKVKYDAVLVPKYTNPDPEQPTVPPTTPERPPSQDVPILGIEDISPYIGIGLLAIGVILLLMAVILIIRRKA